MFELNEVWISSFGFKSNKMFFGTIHNSVFYIESKQRVVSGRGLSRSVVETVLQFNLVNSQTCECTVITGLNTKRLLSNSWLISGTLISIIGGVVLADGYLTIKAAHFVTMLIVLAMIYFRHRIRVQNEYERITKAVQFLLVNPGLKQ